MALPGDTQAVVNNRSLRRLVTTNILQPSSASVFSRSSWQQPSHMLGELRGTGNIQRLLSGSARTDLLDLPSCVCVGVVRLHSHVPEGQTLGGAAAQHPRLELQLFSVSILELLM